MPYPEMLVAPMRQELTDKGFTQLMNAEEVTNSVKTMKGTSVYVLNSVCGCAAGGARPGVINSLKNEITPDNLYTVFAGQETEAVAQLRKHMLPYPPSSPSIAIFKDGEMAFFMERLHIEGKSPEMISTILKNAYNEICQ